MRDSGWYVSILASDSGVLYTGVTNDLRRRILEHRECRPGTFTARDRAHKLVYFEVAQDPGAAIAREKAIKGWRRARRVRLIEAATPGWENLACDW
jgi:putative endonuclease